MIEEKAMIKGLASALPPGKLAALCFTSPMSSAHATPSEHLYLTDPVATDAWRPPNEARLIARLKAERDQALSELEHLKLLQGASRTSSGALSKVWNNPSDEAYNDL
jgi:hypothetical protein